MRAGRFFSNHLQFASLSRILICMKKCAWNLCYAIHRRGIYDAVSGKNSHKVIGHIFSNYFLFLGYTKFVNFFSARKFRVSIFSLFYFHTFAVSSVLTVDAIVVCQLIGSEAASLFIRTGLGNRLPHLNKLAREMTHKCDFPKVWRTRKCTDWI
jgi:hypothetical protein